MIRVTLGKCSRIAVACLLYATLDRPAGADGLDESCVINILNRTIQVGKDGGWSVPNVPSNMGRVRARATCVKQGETFSGESDYFNIVQNGIVQVPEIKFENIEPVPVNLQVTEPASANLNSQGATAQLKVIATYHDDTSRDVSAASNGTNYTSTNPAIASVTAEGVVTAVASGSVLITARKDEVVAFKRITVSTNGDSDGDGLPDDFETANGLNPNDRVDAQEDADNDGLSNLAEFNLGTNLRKPDIDGDGLSDGEEVAGTKGPKTAPLIADTDGDGLNDGLEVRVGSNPTDPVSANYGDALLSISVTPATVLLIFNAVDNEATRQLNVVGHLIDGSKVDLTPKNRGTTYASSNLSVIGFGSRDGLLFAGQAGIATVTVSNRSVNARVNVVVKTFTPVALASVAIPGFANNVEVSGNYAYVAAGAAGLQVVDVTDRTHPKVVAALDTPGTAIDIRVVDQLAYLADGERGLQIIDVGNPLQPQLKGMLDTPDIAQDLRVIGHFAYLADGNSGLQIIDVANPAQPVLTGSLGGLGTARGVDVEGERAVVVSDSALHVIDLANKAQPVRLGSLTGSGLSFKDVAIRDDFAYAAAYSSGWRVIDIGNPASPTSVAGTAQFAPRDVELTGGLAFYAEQLFPNVIAFTDIGDPRNALFKGTIDLSGLGDYAGTGIALDERYAYVTEENFVVGGDYGTRGNTRLFIAQYRLADVKSVPPNVDLTAPANGDTFIEGETLTLRATATDDIAVAAVNFLVDGETRNTDTDAPFEFTVTLPQGVSALTFGATALDLAGNEGVAPAITVLIAPDPLTTVTGRVVDLSGAPVAGATVSCSGVSRASGPDGGFVVTGVATVRDTVCTATWTDPLGVKRTGMFRGKPVRGGVTDGGTIVVIGGRLNDTGITTCGNFNNNGLKCPVGGFPGQDAEHGRDVTVNDNSDGRAGFSFTKLAADGSPLPVDATTWSCVRDNVTGLIWEVKTADNGLRDWRKTYINYSAAYNPKNQYGGASDASGFVAAVNAQGLCGAKDWRLPTADELQSLVEYNGAWPTIETTYFPNTQSIAFWSSSPSAGAANVAWYVNFNDGSVYDWGGFRYSNHAVRLVRDGP